MKNIDFSCLSPIKLGVLQCVHVCVLQASQLIMSSNPALARSGLFGMRGQEEAAGVVVGTGLCKEGGTSGLAVTSQSHRNGLLGNTVPGRARVRLQVLTGSGLRDLKIVLISSGTKETDA